LFAEFGDGAIIRWGEGGGARAQPCAGDELDEFRFGIVGEN
jgi:hypothetical protein